MNNEQRTINVYASLQLACAGNERYADRQRLASEQASATTAAIMQGASLSNYSTPHVDFQWGETRKEGKTHSHTHTRTERGGEREREREGDHTNPELLHGMITVDSAMLHVGSHCGIGQVETVQCSMARIIMLAAKSIN